MGFSGFIVPCAQFSLEGLIKAGGVAGEEVLGTCGSKIMKKPAMDAFFKTVGAATEGKPVLTRMQETVQKVGKEYSNCKMGNWAKTAAGKVTQELPLAVERSPVKSLSLPGFVGRPTAQAQAGVQAVIRKSLFAETSALPALPRSLPGPHYTKLQYPAGVNGPK